MQPQRYDRVATGYYYRPLFIQYLRKLILAVHTPKCPIFSRDHKLMEPYVCNVSVISSYEIWMPVIAYIGNQEGAKILGLYLLTGRNVRFEARDRVRLKTFTHGDN